MYFFWKLVKSWSNKLLLFFYEVEILCWLPVSPLGLSLTISVFGLVKAFCFARNYVILEFLPTLLEKSFESVADVVLYELIMSLTFLEALYLVVGAKLEYA